MQSISDYEIDRVQKLLQKSKSPLLLLGGGAVNASVEIKNFVEKYNIPVVSTLMGIGVFPSQHNLYLGMIGINGIEIANIALDHSDLIIALGVSFSDRSTCKKEDFAKKAKIINLEI